MGTLIVMGACRETLCDGHPMILGGHPITITVLPRYDLQSDTRCDLRSDTPWCFCRMEICSGDPVQVSCWVAAYNKLEPAEDSPIKVFSHWITGLDNNRTYHIRIRTNR